MKEIRTREENLDDLRKRKRTVMVKAEAAEKKLNRMGSEVRVTHSLEMYLCLIAPVEQIPCPTDQLAGPADGRNATTRHGDPV
jgi:hypothetical protein